MLILNSRNRMHGLLGHARMALVFGASVLLAMFLKPGPVCGEDAEVGFPERVSALIEEGLHGMTHESAAELVAAEKVLFVEPWKPIATEKLHESYKEAYYQFVTESISDIRSSVENGSSVIHYVNGAERFKEGWVRGARNIPLETPISEMIEEWNYHVEIFTRLLADEIRDRYAKQTRIVIESRACDALGSTSLPEAVRLYFEKVPLQEDLQSDMYSLILTSVIQERERREKRSLQIRPGFTKHKMNHLIGFYANDGMEHTTKEDVSAMVDEYELNNPGAFGTIVMWDLDVQWAFNQVITNWISDTEKQSSSRFRMKQGDSTCTTFVYKKPEREREEEAD